ncbi:heat shock 70 kDa protein 12A-like [Mytilus galloprovincialis]|uniref:heat shock 70 kDa protein 12A-like n=1 Tax=Mytilus galloprovincialis TaxID=29158 RepID=UPI003F7B9429
MGTSNSKKTNDANTTVIPDHHEQQQKDNAQLKKESRQPVKVTNQTHHQTTGTLQSLQKQQQDRTSLNNAPKPSVVYTSGHRPGKASSLKTKQLKREVIVAIEIGYSHSGYVFCLGEKYALEGVGLYCPNWEAKDKRGVNFKTSTAILFRPNKSIHSIGYEAEEHVSRIQGEPDAGKWFFFKNFMVEFNNLKGKAVEDFKIKDFCQNKVTMKAVDVISSFISQMKDELRNELSRHQLGYNDNDIQWMLTTPGKLEPSQLQLMNTAAIKAGIKNDQLTLVQGPEAELMYNRTFTRSPSTFGEYEISPLPKNYRSILVHLGGVAMSLTVVDVNETKTKILETIFNTNESAKDEFLKFLTRLFGGDVLTFLREYHPLDYSELLYNFEKKMRYFQSDKVVTVRVPPGWYDAYKEFTGDTLTNTINQTTFSEAVTFQNDKIRISPEFFRKFYENATQCIMEEVETTLEKQPALEIGIVFVAGDHVDRVFVNTLKERYPALRVIVSINPELVVLKGSVLYEIME